MIPAYITFVVDNNRYNANTMNIADDIEMSSITSSNDDEYLNYDKDLLSQNIMMTTNMMEDVITNLEDDDDDDDTMETIIRTPELYNESSRMMMMTDGFGFVNSSKKEDYCYINTNPNTNMNTNNGNKIYYDYNCNYNSNINHNHNHNYNCNNNNTITNTTNIISYECGSLFEDYDDVMFPSDTIITVD